MTRPRTSPETAAQPRPSAITPSIWWVGRGNWGGHPALTHRGDANIYLLKGDRFDVLIDSGFTHSLGSLERNVRGAGSEPGRIREIWCTHSHFDHFIRAGHWAARHGARCRIARIAVTLLRRRDYRLVSHEFAPGYRQRLRVPQRLSPIDDGDTLECPPHKLRAVAMPGHVPDALGFRGRVDGLDALFSGDAAIGDQHPREGVLGWIDGYWLSHLGDYEQTLARLAADPPELLLPGHGVPHAFAAARRSVKNCYRAIRRFNALPDVASFGPWMSRP